MAQQTNKSLASTNMMRITEIDEEIRVLRQQRQRYVEQNESKEKCKKECINDYDRIQKSKQQFESMVEDSVSYFRRHLFETDSRVKILKRSFENAKAVLYGSKMQEATNELQQGSREISSRIAQYDDDIRKLEEMIRQIDNHIYALKQERSALHV